MDLKFKVEPLPCLDLTASPTSRVCACRPQEGGGTADSPAEGHRWAQPGCGGWERGLGLPGLLRTRSQPHCRGPFCTLILQVSHGLAQVLLHCHGDLGEGAHHCPRALWPLGHFCHVGHPVTSPQNGMTENTLDLLSDSPEAPGPSTHRFKATALGSSVPPGGSAQLSSWGLSPSSDMSNVGPDNEGTRPCLPHPVCLRN